MAQIFTTEIASDHLASDNPVHQRLYKAYIVAQDSISGHLLEVGCGEGRGIEALQKKVASYTGIDKIEPVIQSLREKFPQGKFFSMNIPPFHGLPDNTFNSIVSFQVIEHIQEDLSFLREIHRVLAPGGIALITTPNRIMSLSRNPWHVREYTPQELLDLARSVFGQVTLKGISGNERVMDYYARNKKSVERLMRWDILGLQHRLPSALLKIPYEILNRWNRNKLKSGDEDLVSRISHEDYLVVEDAAHALDLLLIVHK